MDQMRPNIVFVMMDDLGWRDLSCYGSDFYETPNLDRLAAEGMRFTEAYATAPICSPTRARLMTGRYPARIALTQFIGGHSVGRLCDVPYMYCLPMNERTIATALREGGYQTFHVGKWHLGAAPTAPDRHGFDVNIAGCEWGMPMGGFLSPWQCPTMDDGPEGQHLTDGLTDAAIRLIRGRDRQRPFFLNLAHYAVHIPVEAPESLVEKYRRKADALELRDEDALEPGEYHPCQHKRTQRLMRRRFQSDAAYAAMVEQVDAAMGRLMNELDEQGLRDNTLIVFTSDHGGLATSEGSPTCNAPLAEGKGWLYEGGIRVCQIARWPAVVAAGSECHTPCTTTDWYPTLLTAAGLPAEPEQHTDGVELMPLLRGEACDRGPIYWHYPHYSNQGGPPAGAMREGDWKLIEFFEDGHLELYHLGQDLGEQHDRSAAEPQRTAAMHAALERWRSGVDALMPKPNPNYRPPPSA